jgi:hypothetical protein
MIGDTAHLTACMQISWIALYIISVIFMILLEL